jgi:transcription elongation factor Elf1
VADTSYTDQPTCPHCGYVETDAWEIDFGGMEGDVVMACGKCDEDYNLSRSVTIHYSSEPLRASQS